nr:PREDICTED: F-box protein FBW2-like [Musa acuminata subsp. malaccensis]
MNPEVLALVFVGMPADVLARTVPFVCRSWREVMAGPYCWSEIDLDQWCRRIDRSDVINFVVRRLVRRSRGTLRRLSAYRLSNSGFVYVATSVRFLSVLQIPMSDVTDQIVEKHVESFSTLTVLDISYCLKITSKGMEALGKHCKALVQLTRNMPPPEFETTQDDGVAAKVDEEEAMAIANNMAGLEHVELAYGKFSHHGLAAILTNCTALKILDVRGCWNVKMEDNIEAMCAKIQSFRDPWEDDYEFSSSEDEGDNSSAEDVGLVDCDASD